MWCLAAEWGHGAKARRSGIPGMLNVGAAHWNHKLSTKMAVVTLLLPIPSLLFGSAMWTLTPKQYKMLHHGGTMEENAEWMSSHGRAMPMLHADSLEAGWNAPLRSSQHMDHVSPEDALADLDETNLGRLQDVFQKFSGGGGSVSSALHWSLVAARPDGTGKVALYPGRAYIRGRGGVVERALFISALLTLHGRLVPCQHGAAVNLKALQGAVEELGDHFHTKTEMMSLLHRFDKDESGKLEKDEFMAMGSTKIADISTLNDAFIAFDTDEDGYITYSDGGISELMEAARKLGGLNAGLTVQHAEDADANNDGVLSKVEFDEMMLTATSRSCVAILYLDAEAFSDAVESVPLVIAVIVGNIALVGGLAGMPPTYPVQIGGVLAVYTFGSVVRIWLVRSGASAAFAWLVWLLFAMIAPLGSFCKLCLDNAGLSQVHGLGALGAWLATVNALVDLAYRHCFLSLLEGSMFLGVFAVFLALIIPSFLNLLNNVAINREWRRVQPMLPYERSRPFTLCAYLVVARAQREMLADIFLSANNWPLAYPTMLLMGGARYYANRASAKLVDRGVEAIPVCATKAIASSWAELWAVSAVGAAHLVSSGSCVHRHHEWGTVDHAFIGFVLCQLVVELVPQVLAVDIDCATPLPGDYRGLYHRAILDFSIN